MLFKDGVRPEWEAFSLEDSLWELVFGVRFTETVEK